MADQLMHEVDTGSRFISDVELMPVGGQSMLAIASFLERLWLVFQT